jgi:hypothetical protein
VVGENTTDRTRRRRLPAPDVFGTVLRCHKLQVKVRYLYEKFTHDDCALLSALPLSSFCLRMVVDSSLKDTC